MCNVDANVEQKDLGNIFLACESIDSPSPESVEKLNFLHLAHLVHLVHHFHPVFHTVESTATESHSITTELFSGLTKG